MKARSGSIGICLAYRNCRRVPVVHFHRNPGSRNGHQGRKGPRDCRDACAFLRVSRDLVRTTRKEQNPQQQATGSGISVTCNGSERGRHLQYSQLVEGFVYVISLSVCLWMDPYPRSLHLVVVQWVLGLISVALGCSVDCAESRYCRPFFPRQACLGLCTFGPGRQGLCSIDYEPVARETTTPREPAGSGRSFAIGRCTIAPVA